MEEIKVEKDVYSFLYYNCFGTEKNIFDMAIDRGYLDVQRTIRWDNKKKNKEKVKANAKEAMKEGINKILNTKSITQEVFDKMHKDLCQNIIAEFNKESYDFNIGQVQKWINMTFKYLYIINSDVVEDVLPVLHIPIDSYVLEALKNEEGFVEITGQISKFNDYDLYLKFQKWFDTLDKEYPLKREFKIWEESVKN